MAGTDSEPEVPAATPRASRLASIWAALGAVNARVADARTRLETSRSSNTAIDQALRTLELDSAAGGGVLASAVAFRLFLLAVPYIFFLTVATGAAGDLAGQPPGAIVKQFGIGGLVAQAVSTASQLSGFSRLVAVISGLAATWLAARSLLRTLRIVHGLLWRVPVPKQRRPNLAALVLIALVTCGLLLTIVIGRLDRASALGLAAGFALSVAVPTLVWLLVSYALPHAPDATWRDMLPGSLLFGAASLVLHLFTVLWISHLVDHKSQTYGSIAAALGVLLWSYVLGRIITASAAVNRSALQSTYHDG